MFYKFTRFRIIILPITISWNLGLDHSLFCFGNLYSSVENFLTRCFIQKDFNLGNIDLSKVDDGFFFKITSNLFHSFCFVARSLGSNPEEREYLFYKNPSFFQKIHVNFWRTVLQQSNSSSLLNLWKRFYDFKDVFVCSSYRWCNG